MDKKKVEVPKICALCSSRAGLMVFVRSSSDDDPYVCSNINCAYISEVWNIAKSLGDLNLLSELASQSGYTGLNGEEAWGEKQEDIASPDIDKNLVADTSSSSIQKLSPRKQVSPRKRGKIGSKNEVTKESLQESDSALDDDKTNEKDFSGDKTSSHLVLRSHAEKEELDSLDKARDGICALYENFVIWPNRDALCWLNSAFALLLHSCSIRRFAESSISGDCEMTKIYNDYKSILDGINGKSPTASTFISIKKQLHVMQENTFKFLQKNMRCVKGQPDSPMFTIPHLIKEHDFVKNMFEFKYWWSLDCEKCSARCVFQGIKTIVSFGKIAEDFSMTSPGSLSICKKCLAHDQRKTLNFDKLPQSLLFHFEQGYGKNDLLNTDFEFQGQKYAIKGFILYTKILEQMHFVTWIRDIRNNKWLNCDDLQPGLHQFTSTVPKFKPSEVHIVMWECTSPSTSCINAVDDTVLKATPLAEESHQVCVDLEEDTSEINSPAKFSPPLTRNKGIAKTSRSVQQHQKSPVTSVEASPIHEVKSTKLKVARSIENSKKKLFVLSDKASEDGSQSSSTSASYTSPIKRVSEPTVNNALHEISTETFKGTSAGDAENVKGAEKKEKIYSYPEIKLPSFETSFRSFSSMKRQGISLRGDGSPKHAVEIEKLQRADNLKVMLENIFARAPRRRLPETSSSHPTTITAKGKENEKKDENEKEDSISETAVESEVTDQMPCVEFTEPDGTKIVKFNDSRLSNEGVTEASSSDVNMDRSETENSTMLSNDSGSPTSRASTRKTRSGAVIAKSQSKKKVVKQKHLQKEQLKRQLPGKKKSYQTRNKTQIAGVKYSEGNEDGPQINMSLASSADMSHSESSLAKNVVQANTAVPLLEANIEIAETTSLKRKLGQDADADQTADKISTPKPSGTKKSKAEIDPNYRMTSAKKLQLHKSSKTYVKKQSLGTISSTSLGMQSEYSPSASVTESKTSQSPHTLPESKARTIEKMEVEESKERTLNDSSPANQFYKYMSDKIIKNVATEKEASESVQERKSQTIDKHVSNSIKQVVLNPEVNNEELPEMNVSQELNKNAVKTPDERSSASYNLRGKPKISSMGKVKRMSLEDTHNGIDDSNNEWLRLTSEEEEEENMSKEEESKEDDQTEVDEPKTNTRRRGKSSVLKLLQSSKVSNKVAKGRGRPPKSVVSTLSNAHTCTETSKPSTSKKLRKTQSKKSSVSQNVTSESETSGLENVIEKKSPVAAANELKEKTSAETAAGRKLSVKESGIFERKILAKVVNGIEKKLPTKLASAVEKKSPGKATVVERKPPVKFESVIAKKPLADAANVLGKKSPDKKSNIGEQKSPGKANPASSGNVPLAPKDFPSIILLPPASASSPKSTSSANTLPVFTSIANSSPTLKGVTSSGAPFFLIPVSSANVKSPGIVSVTSTPANLKQQAVPVTASPTQKNIPSSNMLKNVFILPSNFKTNSNSPLIFTVKQQPPPGQPVSISASPQTGKPTIDKIMISPYMPNTTGNVPSGLPLTAVNLPRTPQIKPRQISPGTPVLRMITPVTPNVPVGQSASKQIISVTTVKPTVTANSSDAGASKVSEDDLKKATSSDKDIKTVHSSPKITSDLLTRLGSSITLTPICQPGPVISTNSKPETVSDIKSCISFMKIEGGNTSDAPIVSVKNSKAPSDAVTTKNKPPTSVSRKAEPISTPPKSSPNSARKQTPRGKKAPALKMPFMQSKRLTRSSTCSKPCQALDLSHGKESISLSPLSDTEVSSLATDKVDGKSPANKAQISILNSNADKASPNPVKKSPSKAEDTNKKISDVEITYNDYKLTPSKTLSRLFENNNGDPQS